MSSSSEVLSSLASFPLFDGSPLIDQASTKGLALIPIVANNTERGGGELVLANQ